MDPRGRKLGWGRFTPAPAAADKHDGERDERDRPQDQQHDHADDEPFEIRGVAMCVRPRDAGHAAGQRCNDREQA